MIFNDFLFMYIRKYVLCFKIYSFTFFQIRRHVTSVQHKTWPEIIIAYEMQSEKKTLSYLELYLYCTF